jgi:hypothetical protein
VIWDLIVMNMAKMVALDMLYKSGLSIAFSDQRVRISAQDLTGVGQLNYLRIFYRPIWRTPCNTSIKDGTSPDVT